MTQMKFRKATKSQAKLRMAIVGPAGAGKTYSALAIASHLGERVAVIDTEHGSASKYASGQPFEFDTLELDTFSPATYIEAIRAAEQEGYDVVVIDSLSHAWIGKDGALEQVDNHARRTRSGNTFAAWREVTPQHNALVDAILGSKCHVIATMRSKTEWVIEEDERGKKSPRKVGLAPVQREGLDFEFDVTADIDRDNVLLIDKTRCPALKGRVFKKPGSDVAEILRSWLSDGAPAEAAPAAPSAESADPETRARWSEAVARCVAMIHACKTEAEIRATHREVAQLCQAENLPRELRDRLTETLRSKKHELGLGLAKTRPAASGAPASGGEGEPGEGAAA